MSVEDLETMASMPEGLYWEWRTTCEELAHSKTKFELEKSKHRMLEMGIKIAELNTRCNLLRLKSVQEELEKKQTESDNMKKKIESELSIDFTNCVVGEDLIIRKLNN